MSYGVFGRVKCPSGSNTFTCMCNGSDDITSSNSLLCRYTSDELLAKFVVRQEYGDDGKQRFLVFATFDDFKKYRSICSQDELRLHELILEIWPQHLKFDIDNTDYNISPKQSMLVINNIKKAIQACYEKLYAPIIGVEVPSSSTTTTPIVYPGELTFVECITKHTSININRHIIVSNIYFNTMAPGTVFYQYLHQYLIDTYPKCVEYIDWQVNKSIQNWRLIGACKISTVDGNIMVQKKRLASINDLEEDTLVTVRKSPIVLATTVTPVLIEYEVAPITSKHLMIYNSIGGVYINKSDMHSGAKDYTDNFILESVEITPEVECCIRMIPSVEADAHRYRNTRDDGAKKYISFSRLTPSYCDKCMRIHEHDDTLYFTAMSNGRIFRNCRHFNK